MKRILRCLHPLQAEHYANVLRAGGFECEVRRTALYGAMGEIPWPDCAPEIWLRHDAEEHLAARLLEELKHADQGESWRCAACGESLEPQFGACWRCGCDRGQAAAATGR